MWWYYFCWLTSPTSHHDPHYLVGKKLVIVLVVSVSWIFCMAKELRIEFPNPMVVQCKRKGVNYRKKDHHSVEKITILCFQYVSVELNYVNGWLSPSFLPPIIAIYYHFSTIQLNWCYFSWICMKLQLLMVDYPPSIIPTYYYLLPFLPLTHILYTIVFITIYYHYFDCPSKYTSHAFNHLCRHYYSHYFHYYSHYYRCFY
jgi:hypothetical protein